MPILFSQDTFQRKKKKQQYNLYHEAAAASSRKQQSCAVGREVAARGKGHNAHWYVVALYMEQYEWGKGEGKQREKWKLGFFFPQECNLEGIFRNPAILLWGEL